MIKTTLKPITFILILAFMLRGLFLLFGARYYYNSATFYIGGDTASWLNSFLNLVKHGTYTITINDIQGAFFRPPGYSFFMGLFYILSGKNLNLMYHMIIWAQVILDTISVYFIYNITLNTTKNIKIALISAVLYCLYPFAIVWTAVAYAECLSIFLFLFGLYFYFNTTIKYSFIYSGVLIGLSVLTRLQLALAIPVLILLLIIYNYKNRRALIVHTMQFALAAILIYGIWPARNFISFNQVQLTQDLTASPWYSSDVMTYRDYIYSVKTDFEPQFSKILKGETVIMPKAAYIVPGDSEKLVQVYNLCHTCGRGFSAYMYHENTRSHITSKDSCCDAQIVPIFNQLIANQKKYNAANYYVWVPLSNLKKALFKSNLYKPSSKFVALAGTLLFGYRTIMILLGIFGILMCYLIYKKIPLVFLAIGLYNILWYFYICFIYKNMEIRYLLQGDLLLLIPAAYFIVYLYSKINKETNVDINFIA